MIWAPHTDAVCTICGKAFLQSDRREGHFVYETCDTRCENVWRQSRPQANTEVKHVP